MKLDRETAPVPLRIAFISTNNASNYSGGRYHALIMAYALARAGAEVHFVTNAKPVFVPDLDPLRPGGVRYWVTRDFKDNLPRERFDWVWVVPTGIFLPDFYGPVQDFIRSTQARPALLNFESGNWFNSLAPEPRDLRLWDGWQRVVSIGGLVVASARESQRHAQNFYRSVGRPLRFETLPPPINSETAARVEIGERDNAIIAFVRSADAHKGGADLLELPISVWNNRILRVVAGGGVDPAFERQLQGRIDAADNASLEIHSAITDRSKFELLATSRVLLFPSRFEGYGYPPVEAAYMGCETACYDLPVVRESVGEIAHFAPVGDVTALAEAVERGFAEPARAETLRAAVAKRAEVDSIGSLALEIFTRSKAAVDRAGPRTSLRFGPFPGEASEHSEPRKEHWWRAPIVRSLFDNGGGRLLVEIEFAGPAPLELVDCDHAEFVLETVFVRPSGMIGDAVLSTLTATCVLPEDTRSRFRFRPRFADGTQYEFELGVAGRLVAAPDISIDMIGDGQAGAPLRLRIVGQTAERVDEIAYSVDGRDWEMVALIDGIAEIDAARIDPLTAGLIVYPISGGTTLTALAGFPPTRHFGRPSTAAQAGGNVAPNLTDEHFVSGVLRAPLKSGLGGIVQGRANEAPMLDKGGVLRLADSSLCAITEAGLLGDHRVLASRRPLSPWRHGYPTSFSVERAGRRTGKLMPEGGGWGWTGGLWSRPGELEHRGIRMANDDQPVRPGERLVFANGEMRTAIASFVSHHDQTVWLDTPISAAFFGNTALTIEAAPGGVHDAQYRFPTDVEPRERGLLTPFYCPDPGYRADPGPQAPEAGNRVLIATLVPPLPADQGNRVVTRNLVRHALDCGFLVDLLLVGDANAGDIATEFGDRVRVFPTGFPDWQSAPSVKAKRALAQLLERSPGLAGEAPFHSAMLENARYFHPYTIVPDAAVEMARTLIGTNRYQAMICNYHHMLRIAEELAADHSLPPVAVVTHDALSRLPGEFNGRKLDLMYRATTPEMERNVLNAIDGAVILAISESEQRYFAELGVTNPVVLCEYDALDEGWPYRTTEESFDSRALIFHASANPMNDAALDWFLANCWPQIRAEVPDARLSLCGRICKARTVLPDCVDSLGEMTRHHLYKNLGASAVAINPTVAGTGLKIKTVEALAMGLPSVCLPPAIEGLETIADRFALVAEDGESFADACIALLTDRQLWLSLRESALELGKDRFSAEAVYSALDEAMGWTDEADRPPAADHISDIDEELPAELAAKLADLESLNLGDAIAQLLDREAARPGAPVAVLHAAARACLAHDLPSAAFDHILVALGRDRCDAAAWTAAIEIALSLDRTEDALGLVNLARLAVPNLSFPKSIVTALGLIDESAPQIALEPGKEARVGQFVESGTPFGKGWAQAESWGVWSIGTYSGIDLAWPLGEGAAGLLTIKVHATTGATGDSQRVEAYVDGAPAARFAIERGAEPVAIEIPLPASARDVRHIGFYVAAPAPYRRSDGSVTDERALGFALRSLKVDEQ